MRKRKTKVPCGGCFLNEKLCICDQMHLMSFETRVDLVVHYKELKRTTNTGRLISKILTNQSVWVRGEQDNPLDHSKLLKKDYNSILLYPSDDAVELTVEKAKELKALKPVQLIVPDGNWRQASKVHYRVEEFKHLPRYTLPKRLADRENLVRAESKEEGMSTLESIGYALGFLESEDAKKHILNTYQLKKEATLKGRGEI